MQVKLPKQWKHWCSIVGLRPDCSGFDIRRHKGHAWFYLRGKGRHWRVNCHSMLQRGDTYEDFDRWALCDIREIQMPRNKAQFLHAISELLRTEP